MTERPQIQMHRLPSGYIKIDGGNSNDWCQVPQWPCTTEELEDGFFDLASKGFRFAVRRLNNRWLRKMARRGGEE